MRTGTWCLGEIPNDNFGALLAPDTIELVQVIVGIVFLASMKIIPLSEGTFTVDKTKLFVPFNEEEHELQQRSSGSLLVEIQPFVVVTSKDTILLDAGLGFEKNNVLQLHQNLTDNNIEPSDITKVLLTHLHKDHAGGISKESFHGQDRHLSFPGATYYLQERELNFAFEKGFPSFISEELILLKQ